MKGKCRANLTYLHVNSRHPESRLKNEILVRMDPESMQLQEKKGVGIFLE
jgi:hypothetical protein